jgi:acyl-CoA reductase-like NAD-dependent aldehyde dehydrogenase
MKDIKNFINGEFVTNVSGQTFEKPHTVDDSVIGLVHEAGRPEVDAAVVAARAAKHPEMRADRRYACHTVVWWRRDEGLPLIAVAGSTRATPLRRGYGRRCRPRGGG